MNPLRRSFLQACTGLFGLLLAPFTAKATSGPPAIPKATIPIRRVPERFTPTPQFWEYLSLAKPEAAAWLQRTMTALDRHWFHLSQSEKRFCLKLTGISYCLAPPEVRKHFDQQVFSDDLCMVFDGTPRIFEAEAIQARKGLNYAEGDVFFCNPHMFDTREASRVLACKVRARNGYWVTLQFSNGLILPNLDIDDLRCWL